jgi:hypothetical protein
MGALCSRLAIRIEFVNTIFRENKSPLRAAGRTRTSFFTPVSLETWKGYKKRLYLLYEVLETRNRVPTNFLSAVFPDIFIC